MAYTQGQFPEIEYHVFVAGQANLFFAEESPDRMDVLWENLDEVSAPQIITVEKRLITSKEIEENLLEAFEEGYEGIMLKDPTRPYDYKRSSAILKLKENIFKESDYEEDEIVLSDCVVDSIEYNDEFPYIEDDQIKFKRLLNIIWVIQPDGIRCKVGSGYSLDFREYYTKRSEELIGKIVEIEHQKWGANGRMRFPRLRRVREDL